MNKQFLINLKKNKKGTALFMALMILSGALIVSLGAASLIVSSVKQAQMQVYSTNAYYAAESGAERLLWEIRKNGADLSDCGGTFLNIDFDLIPVQCVDGKRSYSLPDGEASYKVSYISGGSATTTVSVGSFKD